MKKATQIRYACVKKLRRRGGSCQFCGTRWKRSRWNFVIQKSGTCQQCQGYLNVVCRKGGGWISNRMATLEIWQGRLRSVGGSKRRVAPALKALAGGRR